MTNKAYKLSGFVQITMSPPTNPDGVYLGNDTISVVINDQSPQYLQDAFAHLSACALQTHQTRIKTKVTVH